MSRPGISPFAANPHASLDRPLPRAVALVVATVALVVGAPLAGLASQPVTAQFQVNTVTGSAQERPKVASDSAGNFVVVWQSYSSAGSDPDRSVEARRYDANGNAVGSEFQVNSSTDNVQVSPAVAMNSSGAFVVVWQSDHAASTDFDIMAQRYNAAGAKVGSELLVNSGYTAGLQTSPAVAMADNGDFVVVWSSAGGAGGDPGVSIQGRRFRASGATFFDQFLVNDTTTGDQDEPAIATDGAGTYLVAWRQPNTSNDIAIRSFTADNLAAAGLTADAPQQTANTFPSGSQTAPAVAMAPDGRAVVAWESFSGTFGNDGSRLSIQARRLDASGDFVDGNDVQINTYTNDDQRYPSVTVAPNGFYAVAWQSYGSSGNDSSDYSIQLRSFDADGNALDQSDVQANSYTSNAQQYPAVALARTGRLFVAWDSVGSPGDDNNGVSVQGRLYQVFTPASKAVAIPAVARVQGSGAFFTSRVDLLHSGTADMEVAATYTPRADLGGQPRTEIVPLPGSSQLSVTDPLATWFGFSGNTPAVGSLLLELRDAGGTPSGDALLAQSVVFARNDDGSEFGQFFPALRDADALVAGQVGYLATTVNAQVYRVNVGLMGLAAGTQVTVTPQDRIGSPLAAGQTFSLNRGDSRQLNNIFNVFHIAPQDNIVVAVQVTAGKALAFASVLDGNIAYAGTNDPTTILPVTGGAPEVTLLELGPIQGLNEFSGSASITNFSPSEAVVRADFFARGTPGVAASTTLTIPGGATAGFEDIIGDLFGLQGVGTLRLTTVNGTLISAVGREFAIFRNGQGQVDGTAGQAIPGMLPGELLHAGTTYHLLGLREVSDQGGRERSHIAAFNPGTSPVNLTVEVFDGATGAAEGETVLAIRGGELIQTNSIITVVNPHQDGGVKRLEVRATGPLYVRAFRVNRDGDPITIPPQTEE
jgi:hypothetical protein